MGNCREKPDPNRVCADALLVGSFSLLAIGYQPNVMHRRHVNRTR